jgi:hypothetical protein
MHIASSASRKAFDRLVAARLAKRQCSSERQPQPMHLMSPPFIRSRCAIRASIRAAHPVESLAQSSPSGAWSNGEFGQLSGNLVEGEADSLGKDQEGDAAKHCSRVTAMSGSSPFGPDQPAIGKASPHWRIAAPFPCTEGDPSPLFSFDYGSNGIAPCCFGVTRTCRRVWWPSLRRSVVGGQ